VVDGRPDSEYTGTGYTSDPVSDLLHALTAVDPDADNVYPLRPRHQHLTTARTDPASQLDREYLPSCRLIMSQPEIDDDPARWLEERRRDPETGQWRVTASELATVLSLAPPDHGSPFSLWHAKVNGVSTFAGNERTELGLYLEDLIASKFAARHPELDVGPGGLYVSRAHPWLVGTPDRIAYHTLTSETGTAYTPAGPVQLKSWAKYTDFGPDGSSVMPVYLRVQLLGEMALIGTDEAWEPVMDLPSGRVRRVIHLDRDDDAERDIAAILAAGEEFAGWLESGREPEVDWTPAAAATLRHLYPALEERSVRIPVRLARRYDAARAGAKAADRRLAQVQNEIRWRIGNATDAVTVNPASGDVTLVARRREYPRAGYSVPPNERVEEMRPGGARQRPRPM
jgi:YqaJ-like viral recombinase domain